MCLKKGRMIALTAGLVGLLWSAADSRPMPIGQNFIPVGWGKWTMEHGTGTDPFRGGRENITGFDPIWTPEFLEEIRPFTVYRFMDWCYVNNTDRSGAWADRASPTDPGAWYPIAFEHMIDLCNRMNTHGWFNVVHTADDNYIRQMARLIHTTLKPQIKCYIEWSNEIWNFAFSQGGGCGEIEGRASCTAQNSARVFKIFEEEFGADAPTRLVKVLPSWTVSWYTLTLLQNFSRNTYGVTADAVAIAPYVGHDVEASASCFPQLYARLVETMADVRQCRSYADQFNIDLVAYEGGQHLISGDVETALNSPLMYNFYMAYYDSMSNYFDLFVNYAYAGYGWGTKEWIGQPVTEPAADRQCKPFRPHHSGACDNGGKNGRWHDRLLESIAGTTLTIIFSSCRNNRGDITR